MLQRLARVLVVLLAIVTLALVAVWVVTNTEYGRARVRRYALNALAGSTHGVVKIGAIRGNLLSGATISGISITDSAGHPFLTADSLSGRYTIGSFLRKRIAIGDLVIYRPDILIEKLPGDTSWNYRHLWPAAAPTPGDTIPGFGSWIRFENARIVEGHLTVRSPWAPRAGITARARDSLVKEALSGESRLMVIQTTGGFQKVIELRQLSGHFPLVQLADPSTKIRLLDVASVKMQALPFRPPAAEIVAMQGRFRFTDDSAWWKGAHVDLPKSNMSGDGVYVIANGDMRLTATGQPAAFNDFRWLYPHMPEDGGGTASMLIQWRGATQDYVMRSGDLRTEGAHILGDIGVTMTDTIVFHDADLRFTGVTTKLIKEIAPAVKPPREGVLAGRAKFDGTPKRLDLDADVTFAAYNRGTSRVIADGVLGMSGTPVVVSARDLRVRMAPLQIDIAKLLFPTLPIGGTLTGTATLNGSGDRQLVISPLEVVHQDGPNRSRAVGRVAVHTTPRQTMSVDVVARPIALAELTKFAPALPLTGYATGPFRANGPIDGMRFV